MLGYGYGRDSIAFWVVHRVSKAPSRTTTATATAGARPPTAEGVRATRMGSSAVVPHVSAADASHIGAISLSSIGLVICRSASPLPFSRSRSRPRRPVRVARRSLASSPVQCPKRSAIRYRGTTSFRLHLTRVVIQAITASTLRCSQKAGRFMSKGCANRRPGLFPRQAG